MATIYHSDGHSNVVSTVEAKLVWSFQGRDLTCESSAITDTNGKLVWFGVRSETLVNWNGKIHAIIIYPDRLELPASAAIQGLKNMRIDDLSRLIDQGELGLAIATAAHGPAVKAIDLRTGLRWDFAAVKPLSTSSGIPKLRGLALMGDHCELSLESPDGHYHAQLSVNLRTDTVTSAIGSGSSTNRSGLLPE